MAKNVAKNTAMLYIMNIAKLIFPLATLPYLTRVLAVDTYGVISYVKAVMTYMQLIIDFGFILSATKDIVKCGDDKQKIGIITGNAIMGKLILSLAAFVVLIVMTCCIKILRKHALFTFLYFISIVLTAFLVDFLFRGLEKMHIITIRFLITRSITTALTFVLIKDDSDIMLIPILEIIGNLAAIIWVWISIFKMKIPVKVSALADVLSMLKESFVYFISNMATTAFGALNTLLVGIFLSEADVGKWGLVMQLVNAVQALYSPVINGIYPHMIREKDIRYTFRIMKIFMPLIFIGCGIIYFGADTILLLIGGKKYIVVANLLRWFIPLLIVSFPAMIYGWPALGALEKTKEVTITTIATAVLQVVGLLLLAAFNQFTLINLALLRGGTEFFMLVTRSLYCWKFRSEFKAKS